MKTFIVDSFTNKMFKGNPAGVCVTKEPVSDLVKQNIASELGFSETAFIQKKNEENYSIEFFTPIKEISLCGHATLASAKILFTQEKLDAVTFHNREGIELKVFKTNNGITMTFPSYQTVKKEIPRPLMEALGIDRPIEVRFNDELKIILIEIKNCVVLELLRPDFVALVNSYKGIDGVLVTAQGDNKGFDFCYRYFWPWAGTNEDPVTGAVQTFLTPYWASKLGRTRLKAYQCSSRTGMMTTELKDGVVKIFGEAVIVLEGNLNVN